MTEVRFYHLQRSSVAAALPRLLERALERGMRVVVRAGDAARVEALNAALWTWEPTSFLPHGSAEDGHAERQPVWLTAGTDNPNGATVLMLTDGDGGEDWPVWDLVCDLFDGADPGAVAAARSRWRMARARGLSLTYWQQDEAGRWQKKAEAGGAA